MSALFNPFSALDIFAIKWKTNSINNIDSIVLNQYTQSCTSSKTFCITRQNLNFEILNLCARVNIKRARARVFNGSWHWVEGATKLLLSISSQPLIVFYSNHFDCNLDWSDVRFLDSTAIWVVFRSLNSLASSPFQRESARPHSTVATHCVHFNVRLGIRRHPFHSM